MEAMRVRALRLADGREAALQNALAVRVTASLDSPAVAMEGLFAVDASPGELGEVRVLRGSRELFAGRVDWQRLECSAGGTLLRVEARSAGGLLLDNEALPCALANVGITTVFQRFVEPYGFTLYSPGPGVLLPSYVVRGGLCEWEALAGFARRAYGVTPYVAARQVMVERPNSAAILRLGSKEGVPLRRLEHTFRPYGIVSKVVLRDGQGRYSAGMTNPDADYYGVRRKRYAVPANEFVDDPALDARQRIRRSMLEKERVEVEIPGFVEAAVGQQAQIRDRGMDAYNLLVRERRYQLDSGGFFTGLTLVSAVYYD